MRVRYKKDGTVSLNDKYNRPEYAVWINMRRRCTNEKRKDYKHYGRRGIKVLWKNFDEFWTDMGKTYKKGLELDRINNDGNYCKENCRWATRREQTNNSRKNHYIFFEGEKMSLSDCSRKYQVPYCRLKSRLRMGWKVEEAITTKKNGKYHEQIRNS